MRFLEVETGSWKGEGNLKGRLRERELKEEMNWGKRQKNWKNKTNQQGMKNGDRFSSALALAKIAGVEHVTWESLEGRDGSGVSTDTGKEWTVP